MKILHIISSISQENGAMNVIMNYYKKLCKLGIQFDFLYFEQSKINYLKEIEENGGKCFFCGGKNKFHTLLRIKKFINNSVDYDIIENHELYLTKLIKNCNAVLVLHSHTVKYSQKFLASVRNAILCKNIDKVADYLISCSLDSAKFFWPKSINNDNFFIMHNAIPYCKCEFSKEERNTIRDKYKIDSNTKVLGYVARFDNGKNQEFLIDVLSILNAERKEYLLMLVGNGKCQESVKKIVENNKLSDSVIFTGQILATDIKKYLSAMDIFLFPSKNEGLGQALIEAQGNGLRCIVSTGIPKEAKISNTIKFIPLIDESTNKKNQNEWAEEIMKSPIHREYLDFCNSGYDIEYESIRVAQWYSNIKREKQ